MREFISDLFIWWLGTFRSLGRSPRKHDAGQTISVSRKGYAISGGAETGSPITYHDTIGALLETLSKSEKLMLTTIFLGVDQFVTRTLTHIKLCNSHAHKMIEIDLSGSTPFRRSDVYLHLPDITQQYQGTQYDIIRKDVLQPIIDDAKMHGIKTRQLVLQRQGVEIVANLDKVMAYDSKPAVNRKVLAAVALLLFGAGGTLIHLGIKYENAQNTLQDQVSVLQSKAKIVRGLMDDRKQRLKKLDAVRRLQADNPSVSGVWEELTRAVPDSAYLTDFRMENRQIVIAGFARSASSLLPALEATPLFSEAEFSGPVVNVPGQSRQRFNLTMKLAQ